jgi:chloramphenicol 3-O-phosphotransferase
MKLIFLHGAPATGKLTVAKALLEAVPGRLMDNHAAIDFARTVFEFGAPRFWELVHHVRLAGLETAAQHGIPLVVVTFCYSDPTDLSRFEEFEQLVLRTHGELIPVFLHCPDEEIARRIGNPDRVQRRKTSSMEALSAFRTHYDDAPVPRAECLKINSAAGSAEATAREIIQHFDLR